MVTLAQRLQDDAVGFDQLQRDYGPLLGLVRELIGVVPNCDKYLEIWPPGFRTYNLMVPNFLNVPALLLGASAPKDLVGLAMYESSRAAESAYCAAQTCSFALRRGAVDDAIIGRWRNPTEDAVITLAAGLSTVPDQWQPSLAEDLATHLSPAHVEWIGMSIAMMGFLNKFMDACGIELEAEVTADVAALIGPSGWTPGQHDWVPNSSQATLDLTADVPTTVLPDRGGQRSGVDSAGTYLRVARLMPGALRREREWMQSVPSTASEGFGWLQDGYGWTEPRLLSMLHRRPARALVGMLAANLSPEDSELGIGLKAIAGMVFGEVVGNQRLVEANRSLALERGESMATMDLLVANAAQGTGRLADSRRMVVAHLATAISSSPSALNGTSVDAVREVLSATEIVELITWVSLQQLLHRLDLFHAAVPRHAS